MCVHVCPSSLTFITVIPAEVQVCACDFCKSVTGVFIFSLTFGKVISVEVRLGARLLSVWVHFCF